MKQNIWYSASSFSSLFKVRAISVGLALCAVSCASDVSIQTGGSIHLSEDHPHANITGMLLASRFTSFEDLQQCVQIHHFNDQAEMKGLIGKRPTVILRHTSESVNVVSVLEGGVDQDDFRRARDGGLLDKANVAMLSPYTAINRDELMRVFYLSRRRHHQFGASDVAFYDLAERMACNINENEFSKLYPRDATEKGFINTFNHITAQALMTTLFSEELADFIADVHERLRPELITGKFSKEQIDDLDEGPLDKYVDMINNEWGQELGKKLKLKYGIEPGTKWTPELLANYLNDIQKYYQQSLKMEFIPFRQEDYLIIRFSEKLNIVMGDLPKFVKKAEAQL